MWGLVFCKGSALTKEGSTKLATVARWGFPVVTVLTILVSQIFVPRILQLQLSDGEYIAYVAVMAIGAYLGLADGGLMVSTLREMSEAHGAGDAPTFVAEARRAGKVFTFTALGGGLIALIGIGSALSVAQQEWPGAQALDFKLAAASVLFSICVLLGCGSFHATMCYSTGRLLSGQVANLLNVASPVAALIVALLLFRRLTPGLFAYAVAMGTVALLRGAHGLVIYRRESRGVAIGKPRNSLRRVVSAGLALKTADVLPTAAFPHVLSISAPDLVPAGVPARTLANSTRMAVTQVLNLLQAHTTRRMAGDEEARARGTAEFRAASRFLPGIHLLQLAVVAALAAPVFRIWLPRHASHVQAYLPGMFLEQALLAAALPSAVLFAATDRLQTLGSVRIVGVILGLVSFFVALPIARQASFGIGLAVAAVPFFGLGLFSELKPLSRFPKRSNETLFRYLLAAIAACSCLFYERFPLIVAGVIGVCGIVLLPGAVGTLWRMFRGDPDPPSQPDPAEAAD